MGVETDGWPMGIMFPCIWASCGVSMMVSMSDRGGVCMGCMFMEWRCPDMSAGCSTWGEDDNRFEGSTGGSGRELTLEMLLWNLGSWGTRGEVPGGRNELAESGVRYEPFGFFESGVARQSGRRPSDVGVTEGLGSCQPGPLRSVRLDQNKKRLDRPALLGITAHIRT